MTALQKIKIFFTVSPILIFIIFFRILSATEYEIISVDSVILEQAEIKYNDLILSKNYSKAGILACSVKTYNCRNNDIQCLKTRSDFIKWQTIRTRDYDGKTKMQLNDCRYSFNMTENIWSFSDLNFGLNYNSEIPFKIKIREIQNRITGKINNTDIIAFISNDNKSETLILEMLGTVKIIQINNYCNLWKQRSAINLTWQTDKIRIKKYNVKLSIPVLSGSYKGEKFYCTVDGKRGLIYRGTHPERFILREFN